METLTGTLFLLAGTGIVARNPVQRRPRQPSPASAGTDSPARRMMGKGAMGGGAMMGGMMNMMGGGMCPMMDGGMMGGAKTKVEVKKIDKGVTITLTSLDAATVTRLQKMAEAMRLMHEATTQ